MGQPPWPSGLYSEFDTGLNYIQRQIHENKDVRAGFFSKRAFHKFMGFFHKLFIFLEEYAHRLCRSVGYSVCL